jgi:hypothetical protein
LIELNKQSLHEQKSYKLRRFGRDPRERGSVPERLLYVRNLERKKKFESLEKGVRERESSTHLDDSGVCQIAMDSKPRVLAWIKLHPVGILRPLPPLSRCVKFHQN